MAVHAPIITITGDLASGKTDVARMLAEMRGMAYFSGGTFQREYARSLGRELADITTDLAVSRLMDARIDNKLREFNGAKVSTVVDSRLGWFFIPGSFKVKFLTAVDIAARRRFAQQTGSEEKYKSLADTRNQLIRRQEADYQRFLNDYKADVTDNSRFDLVIDTSYAGANKEEALRNVTRIVNECADRFFAGESYARLWLAPRQLLPLEPVWEKHEDEVQAVMESLSAQGFDGTMPIEAIPCHSHYFINNGHKRTLASLFLDIKLVPLRVEKLYDLEALVGSYHRGLYYDWQEVVDTVRARRALPPINWQEVMSPALERLFTDRPAPVQQAPFPKGP